MLNKWVDSYRKLCTYYLFPWVLYICTQIFQLTKFLKVKMVGNSSLTSYLSTSIHSILIGIEQTFIECLLDSRNCAKIITCYILFDTHNNLWGKKWFYDHFHVSKGRFQGSHDIGKGQWNKEPWKGFEIKGIWFGLASTGIVLAAIFENRDWKRQE